MNNRSTELSNGQALISIIVPVYNVKPYLRQCLKSLVNQTLREIEIICVDDGSTDGSAEILAEYAAEDQRVRVIKQERVGAGVARNAALRNTSAPFIMFCDSDDSYAPKMCAEMLKTVQSQPEVDVGECGYSVVCDGGVAEIASPEIPEQLTEAARAPIVYSCWNKIFRREIIERYDIVFPGIRLGEDAAFCENYLAHCRWVACIKKSFYNYRQRKDSTMHTAPLKRSGYTDRLKIAEIIFEHHKTWGKLTERRDRLWLNFYTLYEDSLMTIPSEKIKRSCFREGVSFVQRWLPQVSVGDLPTHVSWLLSCLNAGKEPNFTRGLLQKRSTWKVKDGELIVNEKWSFCGLTLLRRKSGKEGSIYYWAGIFPIKGKLMPEYPQKTVHEIEQDKQEGSGL